MGKVRTILIIDWKRAYIIVPLAISLYTTPVASPVEYYLRRVRSSEGNITRIEQEHIEINNYDATPLSQEPVRSMSTSSVFGTGPRVLYSGSTVDFTNSSILGSPSGVSVFPNTRPNLPSKPVTYSIDYYNYLNTLGTIQVNALDSDNHEIVEDEGESQHK